jgi:hypothetical protein
MLGTHLAGFAHPQAFSAVKLFLPQSSPRTAARNAKAINFAPPLPIYGFFPSLLHAFPVQRTDVTRNHKGRYATGSTTMTPRSSVSLITFCIGAVLLFGLALALVFTSATLAFGSAGEDTPVAANSATATH